MGFITIISVILLYLAGNLYVFWRLWIMIPPNPFSYAALIVFASVAVLSLFIFVFACDAMPIKVSRAFFAIGASWLFTLLYFVIIFAVNDLIGLSNKVLHFMPSDALTRYTKDNWIGLIFVVGFIALLMICGYLKYQWKVRMEVPIHTEKNIGNRESIRIIAISDLHLGYGIDKDEFEGWIATINKEKPDVIVIAGDIIDNSVRPLNDNKFYESFSKFEAPLGVYACLGNHEYMSGIDKSLDFLSKTGITVLKDSHIMIDSTLCIIGRDDYFNMKRKSLQSLTASLSDSVYTILLDHQPHNIEEPAQYDIDLVVAGHTHQGQVWPLSMVTKQLYKLDHGHKKVKQTDVVVSSGIGIWGGKFRIGTQSEYYVIDVSKK